MKKHRITAIILSMVMTAGLLVLVGILKRQRHLRMDNRPEKLL